MAKCPQTLGGIPLTCETSMGGIKKVFIADWNNVTGVEEQEGMITAITMDSGKYFNPYEFRKQTGSMNSTLTADETAGVNYVTTELSLVFTKMETAKRIEMSALSKGQLAVIVLDCNGKYWFLGKDDYVSSSIGGASTGTNKGDQNAYTLTLKDESETYPFEIMKSAVEAVINKEYDKGE